MGRHKEKSKKYKRKEKQSHKRRASTSSSSSESDEWVEKGDYSSEKEVEKLVSNPKEASHNVNQFNNRNDWMSLPSSFLTESNLDRRKSREENKRIEKERAKYNPRECTRELNPYWKDGGDGLPKFKKPSDSEDIVYKKSTNSSSSSSWRKKRTEIELEKLDEVSTERQSCEVLSEKEMNLLASKLIKAEIMGNEKLVQELKQKLDNARKQAGNNKREEVILTQTDSQGHSRPLKRLSDYSEPSSSRQRKKKIETHEGGQRTRYFADDDKHSLQQMFENEKYNTVDNQEEQFMKLASKIRKNDDMDEIFADNIRRKESDSKSDLKNKHKAIDQHNKITQNVENCKFCVQSESMLKHLLVTLGQTVFLALPSHEPLTQGHCLIVPVRHVSCSTLLDENEWSEVMDFRKALVQMFQSKNEDVIFFETARNFHNYPHMCIECIPLDKEEGDMAPIYFKKAIDECEAEWAQNKKLVSLKDKNVRKAIPKGLPYFFVSFGMQEGYAHVLEDQKSFPNNFAQEIIGGMMDLHHSKWRKPKSQSFDEQKQRIMEFSKTWAQFDCIKTENT